MDTPVIRRKRTFVVKQGKACTTDAGRAPETPPDKAQARQGGKAKGKSQKPLTTAEKPPEQKTAPKAADKPRNKKHKRPVFKTAQEGIDLLVEHWPKLFSHTQPKPLKIGLWHALVATEKLSRRQLRAALKIYCHQRSYRQAVAAGGQRYDLDGKPVEAISDEHRQMAEQSLQGKPVTQPKTKTPKAGADAS